MLTWNILIWSSVPGKAQTMRFFRQLISKHVVEQNKLFVWIRTYDIYIYNIYIYIYSYIRFNFWYLLRKQQTISLNGFRFFEK